MSGIQQQLLGGPFGAGAAGDPNWQNVTLLSGTTSTNAGQNNTFLDSSSNNFSITRNGNTTQGSFSPFSQADGYWSALAVPNGTNSIDTGYSGLSGTGNYTVSFWINLNSFTGGDNNGDDGGFVYIYDQGNSHPTYPFAINITKAGKVTVTDSANFGAPWYSTFNSAGSYNTSYSIGLNVWNYIHIVRSSGTLSIYANGNLQFSTSQSNSMAAPVTNGKINPGNGFDGYISNFRIVTSAITDASPPTEPSSTSTSNQVFLGCSANRFIDTNTATTAKTVTKSGTTSIHPFQPFGAPTSPYSTTNVGGSGYFDGSGDFLTATLTSQAPGTGNFTYQFWVYPLDNTAVSLFDTRAANNNTTGFTLLINGSSQLAAYTSTTVLTGSGTVPLNAWSFVTVTRSGSTLTIYLNGTSQGTATFTNNLTDTAMRMGQYVDGTGTYTGYISGFKYVKGSADSATTPTAPPTATSGTQFLTNFTNANIFDNAAKNDMETVGNAQVSTSVKKFGDSSMSFDGTGDYLLFPNDAETKTNVFFGSVEMTIEAWIYPTNVSTGVPTIIDYRPSSGFASPAFTLWIDSGALSFYAGAYSNVTPVVQGGSISINTWTHVAVSRAGGVTKLFINGNQVASSTNAWSQTYGSTERLGIGATTVGTSNYFYGYISDLRITKGLARYPYNFTAPTTSLPNFFQAATTPAADPYFNYTTLLLPGTGTNGAQNNTFLDSSTNAFSITRNGNTTQGTFSPFSQTGWSNFFDGNGDYLRTGDNSAFHLTGDFTIEAWVYQTANQPIFDGGVVSYGTASSLVGWFFGLTGSNTGTPLNRLVWSVNYAVAGGAPLYGVNGVPLNQWVHIAATKSGNTVRLFINGQIDTSGTVTATPTTNAAYFAFIGTGSFDPGSTQRSFNGYISNLRVVKGQALYTAAFTPSTTPLTTTSQGATASNVSLLSCQSNRFVDNGYSSFTLTSFGNTSVQAFSPFAPTAAYSAATNGGSGYFDGTGDYLTVPDNAAFDFGSGNFTLEAFIYKTATAEQYIFMQSDNATAGGSSFYMGISGSDKLTSAVYYGGSSFLILTSTASIPSNAWTHVAFVRTSGTISQYINGSRDGTNGTLSTNALNNPNQTVGIGARNSGSNPITGYLSGARIIKGAGPYDATSSSLTVPTAPLTAITNTSLLCNFTNAGITDATAKNDLETVGNAQISNTIAKWGSTSMYFDGSGDSLSLPNSFNFRAGDWTIECWIYFNTSTISKTWFVQNNGTQFYTSNTGKLRIDTKVSGGDNRITGTTDLVTGQWYHVAATRYGATQMLFLNGQLEGTFNLGTSSLDVRTDPTTIGGTFEGYIQDMRVTTGVARYTSNFTPPTAAFQLL